MQEASIILDSLVTALDRGCRQSSVQLIPHLVLLDRSFYLEELHPLLTRWLVLWMRQNLSTELSDKEIGDYLSSGPESLGGSMVVKKCTDEILKTLNLSRDWLNVFLPFVLSKINRVHYGILSPEDAARCLETNPLMPKSRLLVAVPFVGKDVPSLASEFSHPDIVIGLTILAFRYEGLRKSDCKMMLERLQQQLQEESGPYNQRPAWKRFARCVCLSGGRVRGVTVEQQMNIKREANQVSQEVPDSREWSAEEMQILNNIWPLQLVDLKSQDGEHLNFLLKVLKQNGSMQQDLLFDFIFPETMHFQDTKLCASGQDLGGDLLFGLRLGFSGTPSDLLPMEMRPCCYEEGDDARVMQVLMSPHIVSFKVLNQRWSVDNFLREIATTVPPYHSLIDTGALVTGYSNCDVARRLLVEGLPMDGVIYLDDRDVQMIFIRDGYRSIELSKCSIPRSRRFTFFDQVHTTGMDIPQSLSAKAAITLGKDMTFRDYAQGAYRMRGISKGQTVEVYVTPEVEKLIDNTIALTGDVRLAQGKLEPAFEGVDDNNPVVKKLKPILDVLPTLDSRVLKYILEMVALRLQGRNESIDTDSLLRVMADVDGHDRFLDSCTYLLKKVGKKGATAEILRKILGPIGFAAEHIQVLEETLQWVQNGAIEIPQPPVLVQNQTEHPKVAILVGDHPASACAEARQQMLVNICAWLVVNSMRTEKVQFNLLCQQSVNNVYRKFAFRQLLANHVAVGTEDGGDSVSKYINVFRERVDFSVGALTMYSNQVVMNTHVPF
eukprot:SAG31_NODE_1497_length_8098_cov_4.445806_2_plen_778_part_00